jgi:hypothetical protein
MVPAESKPETPKAPRKNVDATPESPSVNGKSISFHVTCEGNSRDFDFESGQNVFNDDTTAKQLTDYFILEIGTSKTADELELIFIGPIIESRHNERITCASNDKLSDIVEGGLSVQKEGYEFSFNIILEPKIKPAAPLMRTVDPPARVVAASPDKSQPAPHASPVRPAPPARAAADSSGKRQYEFICDEDKFSLEIAKGQTVSDAKKMVAEHCGTTFELVTLLYLGRQLKDQIVISSLRVPLDGYILVHIREMTSIFLQSCEGIGKPAATAKDKTR